MTAPDEPPADKRVFEIDPKRHPAALAVAISDAWGPYRRRAYAVGLVTGLAVGGVIGPVVTTSIILVMSLAGSSPATARWPEIVWTVLFAVVMAAATATAYARWRPQPLRMAAETYIWLARRAEEHWARVYGTVPVPRDEPSIRALLATAAATPETAGERSALWVALLELDRARAAMHEMPQATAVDTFTRASSEWLVDFVAGTTNSLAPLQPLIDAIDDADERMEAEIHLALSRARVAFAEGQDWRLPLAAVRSRLGPAPTVLYQQLMWMPTFRRVLLLAAAGVAVFWAAVFVREAL